MAYIFPQELIKDGLFKIVKDFIEFVVVRNAQEEGISTIQNSMGRVFFNKEFNTLRIGLPRRVGNTTLALMVFQHYPSSILFVQNQSTIMHDPRLRSLDRDRVYSKAFQSFGHSPSVVIVDVASYLTGREQENIFSINSNAFIFLG
jgi:hypothetical protein